jgi:hypothetical protein
MSVSELGCFYSLVEESGMFPASMYRPLCCLPIWHRDFL